MSDQVVRAMAGDQQIRAFAAVTRDMTEEARQRHNTSPAATAALGRLMTAGAIMGSMMKEENALLTLQIKCMGPIARMIVTADSKGNVKGKKGGVTNIVATTKELSSKSELLCFLLYSRKKFFRSSI